MAYTFCDLAEEVFKAARRPLTVNEVWELGVKLEFAQKVQTYGKTPWQTLGARLYVDIKENPDTRFIQVSKRPAKFYLKELYNADQTETQESCLLLNSKIAANPVSTYCERDLHALLSTFVYSNPHFNCYTKTIFHENSRKNQKGYNKWLHFSF